MSEYENMKWSELVKEIKLLRGRYSALQSLLESNNEKARAFDEAKVIIKEIDVLLMSNKEELEKGMLLGDKLGALHELFDRVESGESDA